MRASSVEVLTVETIVVAQQDIVRLVKQIDKLHVHDPRRITLQREINLALVPNVKECDYCQGTVDRWGVVIQCRDCGAIGDTVTFIMSETKKS